MKFASSDWFLLLLLAIVIIIKKRIVRIDLVISCFERGEEMVCFSFSFAVTLLAWGAFASSTEVEKYDACVACVSRGMKFQDGAECDSRCMIADLGCYDDAAGCDAYRQELLDRTICKEASSSCEDCQSAAKSCVWDVESGSCFEGSNMWMSNPTSFVRSGDVCPHSVTAASHCPEFVDEQSHIAMAGGKTASRQPDESVKTMTSELSESMRESIKALESERQAQGENVLFDTSGDIEVCSYKTQVVAGVNYFILVNFGSDEHFEITVYKPLPYTKQPPSVTAVRAIPSPSRPATTEAPTDMVVDEYDWCPDSAYESAQPEQICMMVCPKPHCPEGSKVVDAMCAKKNDSCCGFECVEKKAKATEAPSEEPCMMVDCAPGYDLMFADARGCGGFCVAACSRVTDMAECSKMPECKVDKDAFEDPVTFEVSDKCIEAGGPVCCEAIMASCLACSTGQSAAAWCLDHPGEYDCDDIKMPDTCETCIDAGLKWSAGSCFKECAMDTSCWTTLKGCSLGGTKSACKFQDSCVSCAGVGTPGTCYWHEDGYCTGELHWTEPEKMTTDVGNCPQIRTVRIILLSGGCAGIAALAVLSIVYLRRRKRTLQDRVRVNSVSSLNGTIQFDDDKKVAGTYTAPPQEEAVEGKPVVSTGSVIVI